MLYITEDVYYNKIMPYFDYPLNLIINKKSLNITKTRKKKAMIHLINFDNVLKIQNNFCLINGLEIYMNANEYIKYYILSSHNENDFEKISLNMINNISSDIKFLVLNYVFDHKIDNLNDNLIGLDLSKNYKFNHSINNISNKLKFLKVGREFNQEIQNLPESLIVQ